MFDTDDRRLPAAFLIAAAEAAQALAKDPQNAEEAYKRAKAEILILDRYDDEALNLGDVVAVEDALDRLIGRRCLQAKSPLVHLHFETLVEVVGCRITARVAALRARLWPSRCFGQGVWINDADAEDSSLTGTIVNISLDGWFWSGTDLLSPA